jgi:hypothetical protein
MGLLGGCTVIPQPEQPLALTLYQKWELQPGDRLGKHTILGGLGDISIAVNGDPVYAPFNGKAQRDTRHCVIFSTPDVPAYLFRLCGLDQPKLGPIAQGQPLGTATILQFATLRQQSQKQGELTWAIVEPSKAILQRTLDPPP